MQNAHQMLSTLRLLGYEVFGGENAPYIWMKIPNRSVISGKGSSSRSLSWKFFEQMLYGAHVVCTPGVGFGPSGEGYVRFTAFGSHENTEEALERIRKWTIKQ